MTVSLSVCWRKNTMTTASKITLVRVVLIPVYMVLMLLSAGGAEWLRWAAVAVFIIASVSDFLDGYIARHYNQVSDFGKFLDPLADKLTQGTLFLCIAINYPLMWILLAIWLLKDGFMAIMGLVLLKTKQTKLDGARWYGKVCTAIIYIAVLALLFFPGVFPEGSPASSLLILICIGVMLLSGILYSVALIKMWLHNETIAKEDRMKLREIAKESTHEHSNIKSE